MRLHSTILNVNGCTAKKQGWVFDKAQSIFARTAQKKLVKLVKADPSCNEQNR